MQLAAFDGPSPKTFYKRKNLATIFYTTRVIANLVSNFVAILTGVNRGKCNWQHSIAHNRKPSIYAKILQKSFTRREL